MKIGYNTTSDYGQDGVWLEGESLEELFAKEAETIKGCGFEDCDSLELETVDSLELADLDDLGWNNFFAQWRMALNNGWSSDAADDAVRAENNRRGEL